MADSDDLPPKKPPAGAPLWMLTFADLMSLLLAFFVLLFSFSEIDKNKFKELAGSLAKAFGVQHEVMTRQAAPKGVSVIAREFSSGRPDPTPLNVVRQNTTNDREEFLDLEQGQNAQIALQQFEETRQQVNNELQQEVARGLIEINDDGKQIIVIRIREKGSFASGSAALSPGFEPVIDKIAKLVSGTDGAVVVAGHTDDIPINTSRFRSNWDLSSARAATVLQHLLDSSGEPASRFRLVGYAETQPLDAAANAEARARNRRVEVVLLRGEFIDPTLSARESGSAELELSQ